MSLLSPATWQESIRLYATLMIAVVSALAVATLGLVATERLVTERFLNIQSDYHLTSALAAKSSELEIDQVLSSIKLLLELREVLGESDPPEHEIVSEARSSIHLLKVEVSRISAAQAEYGDPDFENLIHRLDAQRDALETFDVAIGTDWQRLNQIRNELLSLRRILDQIGRLHVISHDTLQARHLKTIQDGIWILAGVVAVAVALAAYSIRKGFAAISGLTNEQERSARALRASEQRFHDYAASSADVYWQTDSELNARWIDTLAANLPEAGAAAEDMEAATVIDFGRLRPCLKAREPFRDFEFQGDDGPIGRRWWRASGVPAFDESGEFLGYRGVATDITEQRLATEQSRQLQRVDAIGRLTGGIAHDFNNLLAVILGNLELLRESKDKNAGTESIDAAIEAALRGADLTKNLLSFARRAALEPKRIELNSLVRKTKNWAARTLPETIEIEISLLAGLWEIEADPASMESALLNLFLNARDAMPTGGKLTIETANVRIDQEYVAERREDLEPGRYVMLAVSDTGHGIEKDNIDQIFEPFFTTKAVGEGSGLGLSMVQGFAKQSGGTIRVYSEENAGTTFKLYFKALGAPAAVARAQEQDTQQNASFAGAHVLLVEDDQDVMSVLHRTLTDEGLSVTTAETGDEGLELFKNALQPVKLVVTDIVMPGELQGPNLAKAIRQVAPETPFVFMSGYANEAAVHGNGLKPEDIRLMKPVRRAEMLRAVSLALSMSAK